MGLYLGLALVLTTAVAWGQDRRQPASDSFAGGSGRRPPIAWSEAPLRREQQELLAALSASIRTADRRAVGEDTPKGQDIGAAALRADALASFVGRRVEGFDLEHPITPVLAHRALRA
jgi:hypothetical protein